ncbi:uncharacterized protein DS421_12g385200 [Arachis hypogaea]|nr:uncharacterized protein DS421_12g385200 [Arachis hypogaea]
MTAEKNQRYLMVLMRTKICGIDLMKLITPEKEAVDWENLPPLPFDFSMDLPLGRTFALELDSKIHLVGGVKYMSSYDYSFDNAFYTPCNKVYELDLDKKEVEESKSIDDAPELSVSGYSTLHKIGSDYYFMRMCGLGGFLPDNGAQNFWVLRSGTKVWECLPDAPGNPDQHSHSSLAHSSWFDFYGKLYLRMRFEDGRVFVHSYDIHNSHWTTSEGDNSFTRSFCVPVDSDGFFLPRVHIPDLVDPGKYLALSCERIGEKHLVCAFQVDELGVVIFQRLEGCLDRMPSFFHEKTPVMVDLDGKGTFVVMLPGFAKEQKQDPVLCLLVLQLIAKKVVSYPSRVLRSSVRSPMECEFLDWKVLSMNMYSRKGGFDDWISVSLFPGIPCDEAIAYEVPRRGKRKCSQI